VSLQRVTKGEDTEHPLAERRRRQIKASQIREGAGAERSRLKSGPPKRVIGAVPYKIHAAKSQIGERATAGKIQRLEKVKFYKQGMPHDEEAKCTY